MTTPFTTPAHLAAVLLDQVETRLLDAAQKEVERIAALAAAGPLTIYAQPNRQLVDVHCEPMNYRQVLAVTRKTAAVLRMAKEQADHNVALLEQRVAQHLGEGERVTGNNLKVTGNDLIEGYVFVRAANGEDARVYVRMIWNYRYGQNAANRVLTQYVQFRSERSGAALPGKSIAQGKTEAEKAAKAAEKAERRAAQVEKLQKAPARLAKALRKKVADWGSNHPTAPEWLAMAELAEAMTPEQVEAYFDAGCRTSGDLESRLERQACLAAAVRRAAAKVAR